MSHYYFIPYSKIDQIIYYFNENKYKCIAPRHMEGGISYAPINKANDLPWGYVDEQKPGSYQLTKTGKEHAFGFTVPTASVKPMLFKAKENIWKVKRDAATGRLIFEPVIDVEKIAVFGVRPCDLRGIEIQDRVFQHNSYNDVRYTKRRENQFIIAMNCNSSHFNCFCVTLGDYPRADKGYDLAMTEIEGGFVTEIGSDKGRELLLYLEVEAATGAEVERALRAIDNAANMQHKQLPPIKEVETKLMANLEHSQWDNVASRCLSCGSCTNSCPTCFCHTERDVPNVLGTETEHTREWDSCFSIDHSYTHGEIYREDPKYRYRQWLTHKFATWRDQFRTKGCVGCGRCVTWCPVKIDVVDEINTICKTD